jgi:hypothetical protein
MRPGHFHEHPHNTTDPSHLTRRNLLRLSALGLAAAALAACSRAGATPARGSFQPGPGPVLDLPGFNAFRDRVRVLSDGDWLLVESDGLPAHSMMVGITSWQQQVGLPQPYVGANAWRIPRHPAPAATPISARTGLYRGAIALAVNGIPIFNALNNRGEDAFLVGELDQWGGHGGRADDYHYHIAPLHLQSAAGPGQPIAYALDGYSLYGLTESDGTEVTGLDEYNGHIDAQGNYHYHATTGYPYINGGLRGVATARDGQIDPQPIAFPVRPSLEPLRGATITGFNSTGKNRWSLEYSLQGMTHQVNYRLDANRCTFEFVDGAGNTRTETYDAQR